MFFIIYKITNEVNKKFYIGAHKTKNIKDSYMGSGLLITKAIEKYGSESFKKEVLFVFDNAEDMFDREKELITEELVKDDNCYNLAVGGKGGDKITCNSRYEEICFYYKEKFKDKSNHPSYGRKHTKKSIEKMKNHVKTDTHKNNIRKGHSKKWKISDNNSQYLVENLKEYAQEHNYKYSTMLWCARNCKEYKGMTIRSIEEDVDRQN